MAEKSVAKEIRERISTRLKEIRSTVGPLVSEESELVAMAPDEGVQFSTAESETEAAPEKPQAEQPAPERRGGRRSRKGGTRAEHAVQFFIDNPGASASDAAKAMKIKPNYLYRVLKELVEEGRLKKDGRAYTVA